MALSSDQSLLIRGYDLYDSQTGSIPIIPSRERLAR